MLEGGKTYTGQWDQQEKQDGRGVEVERDKYITEGHWRNGQLLRGRKIYDTGDVYEGHFLNNKKNGYGVYKFADGDTYEGEWKENL